MQTCYNCGKQVSDETLICPECGALVRRYTTPPPRQNEEPAQQGQVGQQPGQTWQQPGQAWQQPGPQPGQNGQPGPGFNPQPVFPGQPPQKLRLRGWPKVWLILCIIFSCYMALSYGMALYLANHLDLVQESLAPLGDSAQMFLDTFSALQQFQWLPLGLSVFCAANAASAIWLLASCRKRAFYTFATLGILRTVAGIVLGDMTCLLYAGGVLILYLSLRPWWPYMKQ